MAVYFDAKHTSIREADRVWLKLTKGTDVGYRLPNMSVLDPRKIGPFKVKRRVGKVAFEIDLFSYIKIHPVISCIHLEFAQEDELRRFAPLPPILVEGEERFIIDRILRKEQRRQRGDKTRRTYYRVRWQGYEPEEDSWIEASELRDQVPKLIQDFDRAQRKSSS
jgi:hypothetical protein